MGYGIGTVVFVRVGFGYLLEFDLVFVRIGFGYLLGSQWVFVRVRFGYLLGLDLGLRRTRLVKVGRRRVVKVKVWAGDYDQG